MTSYMIIYATNLIGRKGARVKVVEKSIQNSLCFGVFDGEQQVGFARIVTDYITFAWLCDVFIAKSHRGQGLGKWLVKSVVSHPEMAAVKLYPVGDQ